MARKTRGRTGCNALNRVQGGQTARIGNASTRAKSLVSSTSKHTCRTPDNLAEMHTFEGLLVEVQQAAPGSLEGVWKSHSKLQQRDRIVVLPVAKLRELGTTWVHPSPQFPAKDVGYIAAEIRRFGDHLGAPCPAVPCQRRGIPCHRDPKALGTTRVHPYDCERSIFLNAFTYLCFQHCCLGAPLN